MNHQAPQVRSTGPEQLSAEWNIYSRELNRVLAARGKSLASLYQEQAIHRQLVKRLIDALRNPGIVSVLSTENSHLIAEKFKFSDSETARLSAAVLASAMYGILMSRVPSATAHAIADHAFAVLTEHIDEVPYFEFASLDPIHTDLESENTAPDALYDEAISAIERAHIALHLGLESELPRERIYHAAEALQYFKLASATMLTISPESQIRDAWDVWYHEAIRGSQLAEEIIREG